MTLPKSMSGLLSLAALAALSVSAEAVPLVLGTTMVTPGTAVAPTGTTLASATNNTGSPDAIERFSTTDFDSSTTDVVA